MTAPRVLIIEDERNFRDFLGEALVAEGYDVAVAGTAAAGLRAASETLPQAVLLDQNLPDRFGLEIVPELGALPSSPVIIIVTAYAAYPRAVEAIKAGAYHYLVKPFEFADLLGLLADAGVGRPLEVEETEPEVLAAIVAAAAAMRKVKEQVRRIASSPVGTVLLYGESGTGKELVARAIHALSDRREHRMLAVNCAALSDTLLTSELFGHERGAFTDARAQKKGVFEAASRGTLFLDEIGQAGPRAQATLLRALEQRTILRVGGTEEVPVDVRIIAASNTPLERSVAEGTFRPDLYHRLNVIRIELPPLRDRAGDVTLLARHFEDRMAARYGAPARRLTARAEALLRAYAWPGNVRELRNAIERAYVVGTGAHIDIDDLPATISSPDTGTDELDSSSFQDVKRRFIDTFERSYLEAALARAGGNVSRAAEETGMHRQVLQRLLARHNIRTQRDA